MKREFLNAEIETMDLVFRANVELVPEETLPRFEMKARLIKKLYEGE